jgi:hypothetical protein
VAFHPRRRRAATVIRGHKDDRAVLDATKCTSLFLCTRIFCSITATSKPPTQPSGSVSDWGWGGVASMLQATDGMQGPDCLNAIFVSVFVV